MVDLSWSKTLLLAGDEHLPYARKKDGSPKIHEKWDHLGTSRWVRETAVGTLQALKRSVLSSTATLELV